MSKLTLIKLGGSVITNKEVPMMVRPGILSRLVEEISQAYEKVSNGNGHKAARGEKVSPFLIGHGQGSFAHAPALRYKTMDGFISKDSRVGMAITQDSAAQLNRIVVKEFISQELPAVSFLASNSLVTTNKKAKHWCHHVLGEYLDKGLLPVTGGDVLVDTKMGCTIWSTEKVFTFLAEALPDIGYKVDRIVHVAEVAGVLDADDKVIPTVTKDNLKEVKKQINGTKGFDVTGGMMHKLEESLALADRGIESIILSGIKKNNLYNCLVGKDFVGTAIR